MTIKVKFLAYFKEIFDAREKVMTFPAGITIRGVLEALADSPRRRDELFAGGALKPPVIVMKNETSIHSIEGLDTPLAEGDTVAVFPFITGG
jgi:sulfur-carrier protein